MSASEIQESHMTILYHIDANTPVNVVERVKGLNIVLVENLLSVPHINYLNDACLKARNLLKVFSHKCWGNDRNTFLQFIDP